MHGNTSVAARLEQFDIAHGNDPVRMESGWLIFSDGAMREVNPMGSLIEPPANPYECARFQLQRAEELARRAVEAFNNRQQDLNDLAVSRVRDGFIAPPDDELEKLTQLRDIVRQRQREVNNARKRVARHRPESLRRRDDAAASARAGGEDFLKKLKDISL